jgi:hypothetical protein
MTLRTKIHKIPQKDKTKSLKWNLKELKQTMFVQDFTLADHHG